jgi:hypothetical protein
MPLDTNLMYGEMVGSAFAHIAIPMGIVLVLNWLPYMSLSKRTWLLLGFTVLLSFVFQFGFLTFLQASSCQGVKNYASIGLGSLIAAGVTGIMIAIPTFFEPLRLLVSQLFGDHKPLLTPELANINNMVERAGTEFYKASEIPLPQQRGAPLPVQQGGAALTIDEYEKQTLNEIQIGVSYWAAFAGAYGIGLGSLIAATCPAVS